MTDMDYERERRNQQRLERLGSNNPSCIVCSEDDPCCLERHHVAGKAFGDDQITVCRNCHRKLSDLQKDHPPVLPGTPTRTECEGRKLLGIADLLELLKSSSEIVDLVRQAGLDLIEWGQLFRQSAEGAEP